MSAVTLLTAVFCLIIGTAVLWANPRRFANQVFLGVSMLISTWQFAIFMAVLAHEKILRGQLVDPLPWIRANGAIASFVPAAITLLKESLLSGANPRRSIRRTAPWLVLGCLLIPLCYAKTFVVEQMGEDRRGIPYVTHGAIIATAFLALFAQSWRQIRRETGIQKLELQLLTQTFGALGLLLAVLNVSGNWFHIRELKQAGIPAIFACYCFIAWAITYHRIFDARQVFLGLAQRVALVGVLSAATFGVWRLAETFLPSPAALTLGLALTCSVAFWLDRRTREWLRLDGQELLDEWRAAVLTTARTEADPVQLAARFEQLLRERCSSQFAALLFRRGDTYAAGQVEFAADHPGLAVLHETGWATPENLQRRRPRVEIDKLMDLFRRHGFGLLVTATRGTPRPAFLLAVGVKTTRWPFTYPEVCRLQAVAELMDNLLSHARLTKQIALEAKMAYLALMSRGLAHDLKNLLTPISSFLVHTEGRLGSESPEAEVHRAAQRSVRLMTDYVRETLFFASRLSPNLAPVDLAAVFASVRDQASPLATERCVSITVPAGPVPRLTADAVLLQRLLGNLVRNALDACAAGGHVKLLVAQSGGGAVRLWVLDDGCGIATENLPRIFDPYFTTKQFGESVRGFGLGLAICEKIAHLHQGTITVHSEPGRGTSVMVELPEVPATAVTASDTNPAS